MDLPDYLEMGENKSRIRTWDTKVKKNVRFGNEKLNFLCRKKSPIGLKMKDKNTCTLFNKDLAAITYKEDLPIKEVKK
jgi:hypothetical protein